MAYFLPRIWIDEASQFCGPVYLRRNCLAGCTAQPPRMRIGAYTSGFV